MTPPPGPPSRALYEARARLAGRINSPDSTTEKERSTKPLTYALDDFVEPSDEPQTRWVYDESRLLTDGGADEEDNQDDTADVGGTEDESNVILPSAPRLPAVQRPVERPFRSAPPLSALQKVGRLVGKFIPETPPPPPLPDGTPVLRKPVTMTTESLQQIASLKADEGISFVMDLDLAEFETVRHMMGVDATPVASEPAEDWQIDTFAVRCQLSAGSGNLVSISAAKPQLDGKMPSEDSSAWEALPSEHIANVTATMTASIRTVLRAEVEKADNDTFAVSLIFATYNMTPVKFAFTYKGDGLTSWREVANELQARNERLVAKGFKIPSWISAPPAPPKPTRPVPRIQSHPFDGKVRLPTAEPAQNTLAALLWPEGWSSNAAGSAIYAQVKDTQISIDCEDEIGFGTEKAIQLIAKHGPAVAQTFIAMINLWLRENKGAHYETYMTARASDLLKAQGRYANNGGFPLQDQIEKGRQVYALSRLTIPRTNETEYGPRNKKTVRSISLGPLVMVQEIEVGPSDIPGEKGSMVTFRFHLNRHIHEAVSGDKGQFAELSSKLLVYHPVREKYQILIGFTLAYYDRVNRNKQRTHHPISLPALLNMACIGEPDGRPGRFLEQIEIAINDLARDGIIPNVRLEKPENWVELLKEKKGRAVLQGSNVVFPRMIQPPAPIPTRPS